jgi:hypothetical protein
LVHAAKPELIDRATNLNFSPARFRARAMTVDGIEWNLIVEPILKSRRKSVCFVSGNEAGFCWLVHFVCFDRDWR